MPGIAIGFQCPNCPSDESEPLSYIRGLDGFHIGMRLRCFICEHEWDEWWFL